MHQLTRVQRGALIIWAACTLLKLFSLAFNIHVIGTTAQDSGAYYGAGYALNHGISPYATQAWQALLPGIESERYVYPPFWAVIWRLPATLDFAVVRWLSVVGNAGLLLASTLLLARACGLNATQHAVLLVSALASVPVFGTFFLGQVSLLFLLMMVVATLGAVRSPVWSGILVGMASGIKLFPAIWAWPLARSWAWRGWLGFVSGGVFTLLVGVSGAPLTIWFDYMRVGLLPDAGPPRWSMNRSGIWNFLDRTLAAHEYTIDGASVMLPAVWQFPALITPLAVLVTVVVLGVTAWAVYQTTDLWYRMAIVVTALLLVMPFQSNHYMVLLLLPVAVLIRDHRQWWLLAVMALCDTVIRYQYNVVRLVDSTWPASAGTVMLVMVWGWLVWQRVSVSGQQSPRET
ncbi:MAG: hypothetical protein RL076_1408 [Chloroflexota bacterium]|jgi:hypothetical protein